MLNESLTEMKGHHPEASIWWQALQSFKLRKATESDQRGRRSPGKQSCSGDSLQGEILEK